MNVKKIQLRNDIITYLNEFPASEVKEIASHVGVSKQALYYHINLLLKDEKIEVVDRKIVNGIEKRFYSTIVTVDSTHNDNDREEDKQNIKVDPIEDTAFAVEEMIDQNIIEKTSISSPIKVDSLDKPNEVRDISTISDDIPLELEDQSMTTQTNEGILPTPIDLKKQKSSSFLEKLKNVFNKPIGKSTKQKKAEPKPNIRKSSSINRKDEDGKKRGTRFSGEGLATIIENVKSLGLFNIDSYDTMSSATALITSNKEVLSFNNRQRSNINVNYGNINENQANKVKRNTRLVIVDENFIDNHERILTPLKKQKDQENFVNRYLRKKYNISDSDLIYTYEIFNPEQKDMYEINTLFSRKKYLEDSRNLVKDFRTKDKLFISIAGVFSHYNSQLKKSRSKNTNIYIFMGKKGCELTWVKGRRILYNRSILVSNQELPKESYLRETLPRVVKTISISLNTLKKDGLIKEKPDKIFIAGPNATADLVAFFNEKYNQNAENINVKISNENMQDKSTNFNGYYDTSLVFMESLKKWERFRYVYTQKEKSKLRKAGKFNLINLGLILFTVFLFLLNIKLFESNLIYSYEKDLTLTNTNLTLKLINSIKQSISEQQVLGNLDQYLANIKINKQKYESLFSLLNSDIFKSIDFKSLEMVTTSTKDFDKKINTVMINAEINDFRPEAILEAENIDVTLKSSDFIKNSTVEKKRYSRGRLPVKITFMI